MLDNENFHKWLIELASVVDMTSKISLLVLAKLFTVEELNIFFDNIEAKTEVDRKTVEAFKISSIKTCKILDLHEKNKEDLKYVQ